MNETDKLKTALIVAGLDPSVEETAKAIGERGSVVVGPPFQPHMESGVTLAPVTNSTAQTAHAHWLLPPMRGKDVYSPAPLSKKQKKGRAAAKAARKARKRNRR